LFFIILQHGVYISRVVPYATIYLIVPQEGFACKTSLEKRYHLPSQANFAFTINWYPLLFFNIILCDHRDKPVGCRCERMRDRKREQRRKGGKKQLHIYYYFLLTKEIFNSS